MNERIYTKDELGLESKKIKQIVLGKRLTFKNVFDFIQGDNLKGYCVTCNADIFLDGSLENLYKSGIAVFKNYPIFGVGSKNYRVEIHKNRNVSGR